ncbi:UDP-N-acetylglucosamine 2-epimerase [Beggiatoa leptomitoformis]|uniref:UDP-N-acetylglucosamine 2-epimerase (Hydrolyzing) n=1 Tax=Beggiatoa leptomitoformis TaxID=288004 RepID=A0A2N9YBR9_9GAMM|nr:UDP-N-acetylglucosamine 2-epimerase [Beggiatoa leptomitoformis]ALG66808.1 UDP-N-acetylglucosamine 2-epimerase (hydrolyzing) [Beggiatoa leptomitoformis]AUI67844.1 UDP-N-acetylglucosamine 2-epimerase (hydrolyzing) [Beggiatoa leptomitoformis]
MGNYNKQHISKRNIAVATGSRAEYGLLYWLLKSLQADPDINLQIIVTGMHLAPEFGLTYKQIENDGFYIDAKVEMLLSSDTKVGVAKAIGLGIIGLADVLERLRPDIIVILGDRFEIFAVAQTAMTLNIPLAHLHGGELTEGAIDEAIRHSITKMAQLHFVAAEVYRQRVIQLGEQPERVFNVGALAVDNIKHLSLLDKASLETELGFALGTLNFLVTYHPITLSQQNPTPAVCALLEALDSFPDAKIIITKANADQGGREINQLLENYAQNNHSRVYLSPSLGQLKYLSTMKQVDVIIGNSSSGLIEAPALHKATVNIGERQQGRLKAESIIDCATDKQAIQTAIMQAISPDFQQKLPSISSLYGMGDASMRIKHLLKTIGLEQLIIKRFYDIAF